MSTNASPEINPAFENFKQITPYDGLLIVAELDPERAKAIIEKSGHPKIQPEDIEREIDAVYAAARARVPQALAILGQAAHRSAQRADVIAIDSESVASSLKAHDELLNCTRGNNTPIADPKEAFSYLDGPEAVIITASVDKV